MITRVNCPVCATKVDWLPTSEYRPFCSERCKRTDLGAWAEEKYVIPVVANNDDENDDAESRESREYRD